MPGTNLKEIQTNELLDKEFKILVIIMLNELKEDR